MKTTHTLLLLASFGALEACTHSQGREPLAQAPPPQSFTIPTMAARQAEYGDPTELDALLDVYDRSRIRLEKTPTDIPAWLRMAEVFITDARITGNEAYDHEQAVAILDHVMALGPDKAMQEQALSLKATVRLSQHRFSEALDLARKATAIDPFRAFNHGLLVDAYTELGQYDSAVVSCDRMVGIRPDLRSYSRVSYQREIHGDMPGAINAMEMAVTAGVPGVEETEWCRVQLGGLHERTGDLKTAEEIYRTSASFRKNYPFALAALASVEGKLKRFTDAEKHIREAIALRPDAGFHEEHARILQAQGKMDERAEALRLAEELLTGGKGHTHGEDGGHGHSLELARFEIEFHNDPAEAHHQLEGELARRPDNIEVQAAMAATQLMNAEPKDAQRYSVGSLRTGSTDALTLCIAGIAAVKNGDSKGGKALIAKAWKIDPYLQHPLALSARAL